MFSHQQHQDYLREQRLAHFTQSQHPQTSQFQSHLLPTDLSQTHPRLANHIPEQINDDEIDSMADSDTTCGSISSVSFQTDAEEKDQHILGMPLLDEPEEEDDNQWLEGKLKLEDIEESLENSQEKVRAGFHREARLINLGERRKPSSLSSRYEEQQKEPYRASFKQRQPPPSNTQYSLFDSHNHHFHPPPYQKQKATSCFRRL